MKKEKTMLFIGLWLVAVSLPGFVLEPPISINALRLLSGGVLLSGLAMLAYWFRR